MSIWGPFVDTFAYCLMGNHFHILIAVKPEAALVSIINTIHRRFKRILVTSERHLIWLVFYINSNPTKHKVIENFKNYPWSSFLSLASDKPTKLKRDRVWGWFGGKEAFLRFHNRDKEGNCGPDYFEVEQ